MKEAEHTSITPKESFTAIFLLGALPTDFLRGATNEKALMQLYEMYKKLPAKADLLEDRDLRTQIREITPYDFCCVSLQMMFSYNYQAMTNRGDSYEYRRFNDLSTDWAKRRDLGADLVHHLKNNSTRLDCTVLQFRDQIPR